ncbi:MAG: hybrid sensor histidine kinase/response regulator [Vicinamibacterales bacterium]
MPDRLTLVSGTITVFVGCVVLAGWVLGSTAAASVVAGWRVMVPWTAFGFVCVGLGLTAASRLRPDRPVGAALIRFLALATAVVPLITVVEYLFGNRYGVESWLGVSFAIDPLDPYAGRMSAITALCFVLLSTGLGALTWTGDWAARIVRFAGGSALTMSWLAVLAVSFDESRLGNVARFPGMAVPTIALLTIASAGILAGSNQVVARLRDASADVVIPKWLLAAAFLFPIALGRVQLLLDDQIDDELGGAIITVICAVAITIAVWTIATRMQGLQRLRLAVLAELEARVAERTRDLGSANERLKQSEERLREADRRKDEFLATLAHELRNPLAPIRTGFQLLKNPATPEAIKTRAHEVIDRQMHQLVRLIDDLLDVSRITADKLELRKDRIDVVEVVQHAVETSRPAIERASHKLDLRWPPDRVEVIGDATRLTQVVANLLQNACKYTPRGGHIVVSVDSDDRRAIIRVRDNGVGIPPAFLPRLFEKFSQVTPALDRAEGGLGLGLALVHGIVTLHRGSVEARSEGPARGSEFVVRLRLAGEAVAGASATAPAQALDAARTIPRRVLVADDNADNADALAALLRLNGHVVETALDGETAYIAAERFRPEVMFLDIGMPKLNGYDVCRKIRQQTWGRGIRVIAQTGWGQAHDRRRSEEAGFDGHLVKPLDLTALDSLLQQ